MSAGFWSPIANHLWQSTVFAALAGLLTLALLKNRAAVRYWLWLSASLKFLVPFSLLIGLGAHFGWRTAGETTQPQYSVVIEEFAVPFTPAHPVSSIPPQLPQAASLLPAIALTLWICGFVAVIIVWCRRWRRIHAAVRSASPLQIKAPIPVLSTTVLLEPGVFGIWRPVLLVPQGITDRLPPAQFDAVVAHEVCHVRRRDNLAAAVHMLMEAIFWFHPLVWWIGSRLVDERERACDEEVLRSGVEPEIYAESILTVCKFYLGSPLACISGVTGANLKRRIQRIALNASVPALNLGRRVLLGAFALVVVAVPVVFGIWNAPATRAQGAADHPIAIEKLQFEVASIQHNKSGVSSAAAEPRSNISLRADDAYTAIGDLSATNYPLVSYIGFAYELTSYQVSLLASQVPKWIVSNRYDIQARAEGTPTRNQTPLTMQALPTDSSSVAARTETRQVPVFDLVLDKPGKTPPLFQPRLENPPCPHAVPLARGTPSPAATVKDGFPEVCRETPLGPIAIWFTAPQLNGFDRPALDEAGLAGNYDFFMDFVPQFNRRLSTSADFHPDESVLTFLSTLKYRLGLNLEANKEPEGFAYHLTPRQRQAWLERSPIKDRMRLTVQSLLADHFKLAVHFETRDAPVFKLVVEKPGRLGPQLLHTSDTVPCEPEYSHLASEAPAALSVHRRNCDGFERVRSPDGHWDWRARNVSMGQIASMLLVIGQLDRAVLDQTTLNGRFDFRLDVPRQLNGSQPNLEQTEPLDQNGSTFLEALHDQLGLKLQAGTGPVQVLVIDHVEQPSAN